MNKFFALTVLLFAASLFAAAPIFIGSTSDYITNGAGRLTFVYSNRVRVVFDRGSSMMRLTNDISGNSLVLNAGTINENGAIRQEYSFGTSQGLTPGYIWGFTATTNGFIMGDGVPNFFLNYTRTTKNLQLPSSVEALSNFNANIIVETNIYGSLTTIASNASTAQIDFTPGVGTTHYQMTNMANAVTLQLTNLYLDTYGPRDVWVYFETDSTGSRNVTVSTNGITTGTRITWGFNSTTNGATSFTVTNRARLNLVRNRAGVISAAYEFQQ